MSNSRATDRNKKKLLLSNDKGEKNRTQFIYSKITLQKRDNQKANGSRQKLQKIHYITRQTGLETLNVPEERRNISMHDQKDGETVAQSNNYRPIKCLPFMWKILTEQISQEICHSMECRKLLPEEQKKIQIRN